MSKRSGPNARLFCKFSSYDTLNWQEVKIKGLTFKYRSIEFGMVCNMYGAEFTEMKDAFCNKTPIEFVFLDGDAVMRATMIITNFMPNAQMTKFSVRNSMIEHHTPQGRSCTVSVTAKAPAEHLPEQVTTTHLGVTTSTA